MGFGDRMRLMRAFRKMSQVELERRTGIDQGVISKIEAGKVLPNDELRQRIRESLTWTEVADKAFDILATVAAE